MPFRSPSIPIPRLTPIFSEACELTADDDHHSDAVNSTEALIEVGWVDVCLSEKKLARTNPRHRGMDRSVPKESVSRLNLPLWPKRPRQAGSVSLN